MLHLPSKTYTRLHFFREDDTIMPCSCVSVFSSFRFFIGYSKLLLSSVSIKDVYIASWKVLREVGVYPSLQFHLKKKWSNLSSYMKWYKINLLLLRICTFIGKFLATIKITNNTLATYVWEFSYPVTLRELGSETIFHRRRRGNFVRILSSREVIFTKSDLGASLGWVPRFNLHRNSNVARFFSILC